MKITYKRPYWSKFEWDLSDHDERQYVTEYNKETNSELLHFQNLNKWIITAEISMDKDPIADQTATIFGKPGKNMGLTYNYQTETLGFEFWSKINGDEEFNFIHFLGVDHKTLMDGTIVTISKNKNKYTLYVNFKKNNEFVASGELIDDYTLEGLLFGVGNPGTHVPEHRYYGSYEIYYFSLLINTSSLSNSKHIYQTKKENLIKNKNYNKILILYDFKNVNNLGIVYDNSKNNNYLERIPKEFLK